MSWAMLATDIENIEYVPYPVIAQPKLNGIRARWDGERLITRWEKVWKPEVLPTLHTKLRAWSKLHPGTVLDGELYAHGVKFQDIEAICAVKRKIAHKDHAMIDLHAFDLISEERSIERITKLAAIYHPFVGGTLVRNETEQEYMLAKCLDMGFEGIMLRVLGCPYMEGRTEALIKVKPWQYMEGTIIGFTEGKGKYAGMLGSISVRSSLAGRHIVFDVGSGEGFTDARRASMWAEGIGAYLHRKIVVRFRDRTVSFRPSQPQIHMIP